ncbi:MAG: N-formylglutamate amidohydrolase [Sneathiella sp.]|nr:N-formylglutamate amidohydrolase [Sneathiella sp.]
MKRKNAVDPVEVLRPATWSRPVIFSSPHSGACYPDQFVDQSPLDPLTLRQSEDFKVDELFSSAPNFGAPIIKATFPRAFCDVNRNAYELDPAMFLDPLPDYVITSNSRIAAGLGTIPKIVSQGNQIYSEKLLYKNIVQRLNAFYFPFHQILDNLIEEGVRKFGNILLIDCHSMPLPAQSRITHPALPDFILGDRFGQSVHPDHSAPISNKLTSLGYSVRYNTPYAGGFITQHYGKPSTGVSALQIEINRRLYMDPLTMTTTDGFHPLKDHLGELIESISTMIFERKKR